jgi:anti-sigma B factor antagonist
VERSSGAAPPPQLGASDQVSSTPFSVRIEESSPGASIVALAGELDLSTIPRMEGPLFEQIRQRPGVLVDLTKLSFIDSSGIGVLIQAFQESDGTRMRFVIGAETQVERVFRIAGVSDALPVYMDRGEALATLSGMQDPGSRGVAG